MGISPKQNCAVTTNEQKQINRQENKRLICRFCQTDIKSKAGACDRCLKNLKEHGKPKKCIYCKQHSAFIGTKCQRCSSSQKKYGVPVKCAKCGEQSAFDHEKAKINGKLLCWLCFVNFHRKLRQGKRKLEKIENGNEKVIKYSPTKPHIDNEVKQEEVWMELLVNEKPVMKKQEMKSAENLRRKVHLNNQRHRENLKPNHHTLDDRLADMKKTFSAPNSPSAPVPSAINKVKKEHTDTTPKSDPEVNGSSEVSNKPIAVEKRWNGTNIASAALPSLHDGNIVLVTKLREEIESLKRQSAKKDQLLLEKDKQLSLVKVNHLNEVKAIRSKFQSKEEEFIKMLGGLRHKNQELLKKIAQISKGKA